MERCYMCGWTFNFDMQMRHVIIYGDEECLCNECADRYENINGDDDNG